MSVKVAVRVRPFNQREKDMGAKLCVKMEGQMTSLIDVRTGASRDFGFDYSFWSHSEFEEQPDGYLAPTGLLYADQRVVYEALGQEVLNNAWEGYHCCLFAYGQTGSGKSYSMVGYGANRGIVPVSSEEIFTRIGRNTNPNVTYEVTVSMLEIYNERVQDLLVPVSQRPQGGLKVRESKVMGVFVENLSKHPVSSYAEIENLMEVGNTNRSIGATQMNATSSRAHTIFTIELKQIELEMERKLEKFSVINLVDLAGSEKAGQTGATGDRLKEGCAINKSLVVLGTVIEALAEKSSGKRANIVIPYRDSALTRILQNALGGNSKTIMICALSPATVNYEETLSTLRYADRAKKIKNNAIVNESVQDRMIRELREENNELKRLLEQAGGLDRIRELKDQLAANEQFAQEQMMSWDQRRAQQEEEKVDVVNKDIQHITNINEDSQLSGRVYYNFQSVPLVVGRKNAEPAVDIVLSSSSVKTRHCLFDRNDEGHITIEPVDESCSEFLYVNGLKVTEKRVLQHLDRVLIGTSTIFLYKDPSFEGDIELKETDIDYEFAIQEKIELSKQEVEQQVFQNKESADEDQSETQVQVKRTLHSRLAQCFPLVNEANLLARDLNRNVKFAVKIINILPDDIETEDDLEPEKWEKVLKIEVINNDYGLIWLWDPEKFEDRLCMLRELLDEPALISPDEDPLWDPPEEQLLGKGYYSLRPLGYLFDNPFDILIISTTGGDAGFLRMNIIPIDQQGQLLEEGPENPDEIIGMSINFKVEIDEAWNIPTTHSNNVFCEYHFPGLGTRRTNIIAGYSEHPKFNYTESFYNVYVDEQLCNYMQTKKIAIRIYGTGISMKMAPKPPVPISTYESAPANAPTAESEMEKNKGNQDSKKKQKGKGKDCVVFQVMYGLAQQNMERLVALENKLRLLEGKDKIQSRRRVQGEVLYDLHQVKLELQQDQDAIAKLQTSIVDLTNKTQTIDQAKEVLVGVLDDLHALRDELSKGDQRTDELEKRMSEVESKFETGEEDPVRIFQQDVLDELYAIRESYAQEVEDPLVLDEIKRLQEENGKLKYRLSHLLRNVETQLQNTVQFYIKLKSLFLREFA